MYHILLLQVEPFVPPPQPSEIYPTPAKPSRIEGGQQFHELRDQCLKDRQLFEDPEFPAANSSLFYSRETPKRVVWRRPAVSNFI